MSDCYRFDCRGCVATVVVDPGVRRSILDGGCPLCETPATAADFEETPNCDSDIPMWTDQI